MVDIIIPAYNAHETIVKTLASIAIQSYRDKAHVYIVDDCSKKDYKKEINFFKDVLDVTQLKLEKNSGPAVARQYAIDHSSSEFILFLDSDDLLYDCYAIENLLDYILDNDIIQGNVVDERSDGITIYNDSKWCLHGKLYRRSLLAKYNIRFNDSRRSEDDAFHKLCLIATDKVVYTNALIYFYRNTISSIVNSIDNYWFTALNDYIKNMAWVFEEAEKRNLPKNRITFFTIEVFLFCYVVYMEYMEREDSDSLLKNVNKVYKYYLDYKDVYTPEEQLSVYTDFMKGRTQKITFKEYIEIVNKYIDEHKNDNE